VKCSLINQYVKKQSGHGTFNESSTRRSLESKEGLLADIFGHIYYMPIIALGLKSSKKNGW
jgi:hypothetical protein